MISFAPLDSLLQSKGLRKSILKTEKVINGGTYTIISSAIKTPIDKGISISAINAICKYLNCQPGDIMEYISTNEWLNTP